MRSFLTKILLFLLPFLIICIPSAYVLQQAGEFYPIEHIVEAFLAKQIVLYGPAYSNARQELQKEMVIFRKPEILALGNSRVGEFRDVFFNSPDTFYNATGAIGAVSDFKNFLEAVGLYHPKILIINMDHYYFNPDQAKNNVVVRPNPFTTSSRWSDIAVEAFFRNGGWWKIYDDYRKHKFTLVDLFTRSFQQEKSIGLRAIAEHTGAQYDGSDYYGKTIHSPELQSATLRSIHTLAESISPQFGDWYGSSISQDALAQLQTLLSYCKERNIFVIGFLPPIAHEEYVRIQSFPDASYSSVRANLASTIEKMYGTYGFEFYDLSDISQLGSSDAEMIDAKHGSEKMFARIALLMASNNAILSSYINTPLLRTRLQNATSSLILFGLQSAEIN